jgi:hypothetical protein
MVLMRSRYPRSRNRNARWRMTVETFEFYGETLRSGLRREVLFVVELLQALGVESPFALNVAGAWHHRVDDRGKRLRSGRSALRPPRRIDLFSNEDEAPISSANLDRHPGSEGQAGGVDHGPLAELHVIDEAAIIANLQIESPVEPRDAAGHRLVTVGICRNRVRWSVGTLAGTFREAGGRQRDDGSSEQCRIEYAARPRRGDDRFHKLRLTEQIGAHTGPIYRVLESLGSCNPKSAR